PFDAHHLAKRVDDLHQVLLRLHDGVDGLVGHGGFIDYFGVLAAFDTRCGRDVVGDRVATLGLGAGHRASSSVAATGKAFRVALATNDVGASTHAAGNNSHVTCSSAHCSLARDQHVLAVVALPGNIVVVAVHRFKHCLEGWHQPALPNRSNDVGHHQLAA